MSKRMFRYTMIKRAHLVLRCGVGSVIRTRQGLTAVVGGLREWEVALAGAAGSIANAEKYLNTNSFREAELTAATGIDRFVSPPAYDDASRSNWELPLLRFPLAGACANSQCRRLVHASHGSPFTRYWQCTFCNKKGKGRIVQLPIFLACPKGHLDEIDWSSLVEHDEGCGGSGYTLKVRGSGDAATATCVDCGKSGTSQSVDCTGARPWLPHVAAESCSEQMDVVSRASVKVYYPSTRSAIHIPVDAELDPDLITWMRGNNWAEGRSVDSPSDRATVARALRNAGWDVDEESAAAHIRHVLEPPGDDASWAILDARAREFEVLSGRRTYPALSTSHLIALEHPPIGRYRHGLIGADRAITGITAVHKLTESRTLSGFSRIKPRLVGPRDGRLLMWGVDVPSSAWLPGYRGHGEGIFLTFNPSMFTAVGSTDDPSGRELFIPSAAGVAVHTLAHLLINQLAENSGYSAPSIRDRVYDLDNGDVGVLIYTAEGDSMGTLGGLVAFAQPGELEPLLDRALEGAAWCPQDPVCEESTLDPERGIHAACHQCVLLPETSCELFNGRLDRRAVRSLISRAATWAT